MKRILGFLILGALALGVAAPAGAFRSLIRNEFEGMFRDRAVCTDGISFDIGLINYQSDIGSFPPDTLPEPAPDEALFITTGPDDIYPNPAFILPDAPGRVLAGEFAIDPIANNDPFWDDSEFGGSPFDTSGLAMWVKSHSEAWSEPLAVGTVLNAYIADDGGPNGSVETITVTDCLLFPCEAEGAIVGTENDDVITGTPGDDIICGLGGNDRIAGLTGDDLILGGAGNDFLIGNRGNDRIYGEYGVDRIFGHQGDDMLNGGPGRDVLNGHQGDDMLVGGPDFDILRGGIGSNTLIQ